MLRHALRSACFVLVSSLLLPAASHGQSMQDVLNELFVFGGGEDPLFLAGSAGSAGTAALHGEHFIPASSEANTALLSFFNTAIGANVANFPLSSTVASKTFRFVDGVPTATSNSFGPIFAERAQTIGRGRLNAGLNYSRLRFAEIRGIDLNNVQLTFVHENSDFPGCDDVFGADCSLYGVPGFENDVINLSLDVQLEANVFAFYTTFGVTDWLDLSVALPIIDFDMRGTSLATIVPTTDPVFHFFGGTQEDPELTATTQAFGSASGIGDIAGRLKALIVRGASWDMGILAEVRAPTGREEDFLGTGEWNAKGLLILSAIFSDFSPHTNVGYEYRGSEFDQDALGIIAGFDQRVADWVTLAVDFLGSFKVGSEKLVFPEAVTLQAPFTRTVHLTNIPNSRDDIMDGSLGFKFQTGGGLIIVTNVLVPLNNGGLRAGVTPTVGLEYTM